MFYSCDKPPCVCSTVAQQGNTKRKLHTETTATLEEGPVYGLSEVVCKMCWGKSKVFMVDAWGWGENLSVMEGWWWWWGFVHFCCLPTHMNKIKSFNDTARLDFPSLNGSNRFNYETHFREFASLYRCYYFNYWVQEKVILGKQFEEDQSRRHWWQRATLEGSGLIAGDRGSESCPRAHQHGQEELRIKPPTLWMTQLPWPQPPSNATGMDWNTVNQTLSPMLEKGQGINVLVSTYFLPCTFSFCTLANDCYHLPDFSLPV